MTTPILMALEFGPKTTVSLTIDGRFFSLDELKRLGLVSFMDSVVLDQLRAKLLLVADKLHRAGELS